MNPEKLLDALTPIETKELVAALQRRGLVSRVTPDDSLVEAPVTTAEEFLAQLSLETRARAQAAQAAMVEKFDLRAVDVSIIPVTCEDGALRPVVISTAGNGLKRGCWDDILFAATRRRPDDRS